MTTPPNFIVDAHLDIAWNTTEYGRDFRVGAHHKRRLEAGTEVPQRNGVATVGLPELIFGRVGLVFGTLFAPPAWAKFDPKALGYETSLQAYQMALRQMDVYQRLTDEDDRIVLVRTQTDLTKVLATWADGVEMDQHKLGIVVLMEGADPIREPKAFEEWYERGVRIVGPAWSQTRYSGGTRRGGRGPGPLTGLGRDLLEVMESFKAILDLSHMAEQAYFEAVDRYGGPLIASHSNPRRFCDTDRHLSDEMIRRLVERDGVMGVVPYNFFLRDGWTATDRKATMPLSRLIETIDYICQLAGSAQHVGIGSDFDGGFGAGQIPAELDTISDLPLIGRALLQRGYRAEDVTAILGGNFLRILRVALPN